MKGTGAWRHSFNAVGTMGIKVPCQTNGLIKGIIDRLHGDREKERREQSNAEMQWLWLSHERT